MEAVIHATHLQIIPTDNTVWIINLFSTCNPNLSSDFNFEQCDDVKLNLCQPYPNSQRADTNYQLITDHHYDSHCNRTSTTVSGGNVDSGTNQASNFSNSRYPGTLNNASFKKYVESLGGNVFSVSEAKEAILNAPEGTDINLLGYSRGGNAAVRVTNWAGKQGINIYDITTFDPHSFRSNFTLKYDNVGTATNYYQRNPTTGGFGILPRGTNPYLGRSVSSQFITVGGQNYTGNANVNHINIVTHVTGL